MEPAFPVQFVLSCYSSLAQHKRSGNKLARMISLFFGGRMDLTAADQTQRCAMIPLRAMQCCMKFLFDRAERPRPKNDAPRSVSLEIERLEDRAAPGSLGGLSESLGGSVWANAASAGWSAATDSTEADSSSNSSVPAPTSPGNASLGQPIWLGNQAQSSGQGQQASPQQSPNTGSSTVGASGQQPVSLASSQDAAALQASSQVHPLISVQVTIFSPTNGSNVPGGGTFSAFGNVSPTTSTMSAWITDSNNNVYNGTAIIPAVPPYNWGFKFTGIPTGNPVKLTVQGVFQGTPGSQTITITPT